MNLNVKSEEARRMARELARTTGQTITAAVTDAIRDRLAAVTATAPTAEDLLAIGRDCASRLPEPWRSAPVGDLLYDERGSTAQAALARQHGGTMAAPAATPRN